MLPTFRQSRIYYLHPCRPHYRLPAHLSSTLSSGSSASEVADFDISSRKEAGSPASGHCEKLGEGVREPQVPHSSPHTDTPPLIPHEQDDPYYTPAPCGLHASQSGAPAPDPPSCLRMIEKLIWRPDDPSCDTLPWILDMDDLEADEGGGQGVDLNSFVSECPGGFLIRPATPGEGTPDVVADEDALRCRVSSASVAIPLRRLNRAPSAGDDDNNWLVEIFPEEDAMPRHHIDSRAIGLFDRYPILPISFSNSRFCS